jgi:hypothetical protein
VEEGGSNEENVEDKEEEEQEVEQEKEEDSSSFEEEGKVEDDEPDYDPWNPLRKEVGKDLNEPYTKEVQRFLDREKPKTMPRMPFSIPYYL